MASTRTTITLEQALADAARELDVNVSAAARDGVASAVQAARAARDREAYRRQPEVVDPAWDAAEVWGDE